MAQFLHLDFFIILAHSAIMIMTFFGYFSRQVEELENGADLIKAYLNDGEYLMASHQVRVD